LADRLKLEFAIVHMEKKSRGRVIGDVRDKVTCLVDDMGFTGTTICEAAAILKEAGATKVIAILSHGIFTAEALERLDRSNLSTVICTNSIAGDSNMNTCRVLERIDISAVLSEAIRRTHNGESVSYLFNHVPY